MSLNGCVAHAPQAPVCRPYYRAVDRQVVAPAVRSFLASLWEGPSGLVPRLDPLVANAILEIEVWTCLDPAVAYPHPRPFPRAVDPPPGAGWTHTDMIVRSLPVIVEQNGALALLHEDDLEERLHQRVVECP